MARIAGGHITPKKYGRVDQVEPLIGKELKLSMKYECVLKAYLGEFAGVRGCICVGSFVCVCVYVCTAPHVHWSKGILPSQVQFRVSCVVSREHDGHHKFVVIGV